MQRKDLRDAYAYYSGKASDIARQLAFAGIAVVWIFKAGNAQLPTLPTGLMPPLIAFGVALGLDFAHYVVSAAIWGLFNRYKELQRSHISENSTFDAPAYVNWPGIVLFWSKISVVGVGHFLLIRFLAQQWALFK